MSPAMFSDIHMSVSVVCLGCTLVHPCSRCCVRCNSPLVRTMTKWGKEEHQGDIKLNLDFVGPPGVAYPQRQPEMDSFDEADRLVRHLSLFLKKNAWRLRFTVDHASSLALLCVFEYGIVVTTTDSRATSC